MQHAACPERRRRLLPLARSSIAMGVQETRVRLYVSECCGLTLYLVFPIAGPAPLCWTTAPTASSTRTSSTTSNTALADTLILSCNLNQATILETLSTGLAYVSFAERSLFRRSDHVLTVLSRRNSTRRSSYSGSSPSPPVSLEQLVLFLRPATQSSPKNGACRLTKWRPRMEISLSLSDVS